MYALRLGSAPGGMSVPATLDSVSARMFRNATMQPRLEAQMHTSSTTRPTRPVACSATCRGAVALR